MPAPELSGALRHANTVKPDVSKVGRLSFDDTELWELPKAGLFSSDAALNDVAGLVEEFRSQPACQLLNELVRGNSDCADWDGRPGRPQMGDWNALYLAYVADQKLAVQAFANKLQGASGRPVLEASGFRQPPTRQAIDWNFVRLERYADAFTEVANELIRHARKSDTRIGTSVFVDSTQLHSPSALRHRCDDIIRCKEHGGVRAGSLHRASPAEVNEEHQREVDEDDADAEAGWQKDRTRGPIITLRNGRGPTKYRTIWIRGHRYLTRDLTSGVRAYTGSNRFWFGGYQQAAVDMYTGLPLALSVFAADINEPDGYPQLLESLMQALGAPPRIASVDRGFASKAFHEYNTRRGIAVVCGFKKRRSGERLADRRHDEFDEYGIPRCRFCGGPGDQFGPGLGPHFDRNGDPYIRFRCLIPRTKDCARKSQRLACSSDWVQLPLLTRESALYHAICYAHNRHEGNFNYDRRRYRTSGKTDLDHPCRSGIDAQRLRCAAGLLLNWFRVSLRQEWLQPVTLNVTRNLADPRWRASLHSGVGKELLDAMLDQRDAQSLELPYGSAARRLRDAYHAAV